MMIYSSFAHFAGSLNRAGNRGTFRAAPGPENKNRAESRLPGFPSLPGSFHLLMRGKSGKTIFG
jgi:hypothetical protein